MIRRRSVEIYFVLYLAALLLLLSDSPKRETDLASTILRSLFSSTFRLIPEKSTMLCRAVIRQDSLEIVHIDSINTIIPTGLIDSVQYRLFAYDESNGEDLSVPLDTSIRLGPFVFSADYVGQALRIRWRLAQPERRSQLYRFRIEATAYPHLPPTLHPEQRRQIISLLTSNTPTLQAETAFIVGYLPESPSPAPQQLQLPLDSAIEARLRTLVAERSGEQRLLGSFSLVPEHTTIHTLPFVQWENRIAIYGASAQRDLARPPQVSGLSSALVTIEGNTIVIRSTSTAAAVTPVQLTLTRRDGAEASTTFTVVTIVPPAPVVPATMYPGVEYRFNPHLTNLRGIDARAFLRDDRNLIRASSSGEAFSFTPALSDTGHTFYFERYAGNERVGQVIAIPCVMFPPPTITSVRTNGDRSFLVQSRSYGIAGDLRARVRLELEPSFAGKVQELFGDYRYEEESYAHIQHFRVTLTGSTLPTVRAVNDYQQRSAMRPLTQR